MQVTSPATASAAPSVGPPVSASRLRKQAVKGSIVSIGGVGAAQFLRLLSNLITTRLLFPEAFGVMAVVNTVLIGLLMMSDLGTRVSVIQNERGDDPDFLNTAWTVEIVRGAIIFLIGCLIAYPLASFYGASDETGRMREFLPILIPLASLNPMISGFNSTKLYQLTRHIDLVRSVAIDIISQATGLVAQAGFAYLYHSLYALVLGPAVTSLTRVMLTHLWMPSELSDVRTGQLIAMVRNRFRWEKEAASALIRTGRWIFVSTAITFAAQRLDGLILPKFLDLDDMGVYGIAMVLALMPMTVASPIVNQVLLPALADAHRLSHDALIERLNNARRVVLPAGLLTILATSIFAPSFFLILYDKRYHDAGGITQIYMILTWFQFMTEAFGRALQAMDKSRTIAFANLTRTIVGAIGCIVGFQVGGLYVSLLGAALGAFAGYTVIFWANHKLGLSSLSADVRYTALGLGAGLADYFLSELVTVETGLAYKWSALIVAVVIFMPLAAWGGRRILREIKAK